MTGGVERDIAPEGKRFSVDFRKGLKTGEIRPHTQHDLLAAVSERLHRVETPEDYGKFLYLAFGGDSDDRSLDYDVLVLSKFLPLAFGIAWQVAQNPTNGTNWRGYTERANATVQSTLERLQERGQEIDEAIIVDDVWYLLTGGSAPDSSRDNIVPGRKEPSSPRAEVSKSETSVVSVPRRSGSGGTTGSAPSSRQDRSGSKGLDEGDLLRIYLKDIGQHPLLTKEDEQRLGEEKRSGSEAAEKLARQTDAGISDEERHELEARVEKGKNAQKDFTNSNLRLVFSIAKRHQGHGLSLLDLIQEGNLGLMRAAEKFDHRKGFKFSTYATWGIRQAITNVIDNQGRTREMKPHESETLKRFQEAEERLKKQLGRKVTLKEIARDQGANPDNVRRIYARVGKSNPVSLNERVLPDPDSAELGDLVPDKTQDIEREGLLHIEREEMIKILENLESLSDRERAVIRVRYLSGDGHVHTLEQVADEFFRLGLTRKRTSRQVMEQIEIRARRKLLVVMRKNEEKIAESVEPKSKYSTNGEFPKNYPVNINELLVELGRRGESQDQIFHRLRGVGEERLSLAEVAEKMGVPFMDLYDWCRDKDIDMR